jgi:hypothetical protein
MGLDLIELELEAEREFDIRITNEAAQKLGTPRQLADYIQAELLRRQVAQGIGRRVGCASQAAFYRLRTALVRVAGVPRNAVRPDTRLVDLLPNERVRAQWAALAQVLEMRALPRLQVGPREVWGALAVGGVIGIPLFWYEYPHRGVVVASVLLMLVLTLFMMHRCARQIPQKLGTVRSLLPYMPKSAGVLPVVLAPGESVDPAILAWVISMTARIVGLPAEEILPDHAFIEDLGMG